jgi:hypothetical protein
LATCYVAPRLLPYHVNQTIFIQNLHLANSSNFASGLYIIYSRLEPEKVLSYTDKKKRRKLKETIGYGPGNQEIDEGEIFVIKAEQENPDSQVFNVFNLSPEDKDILKKEVEKWGGFIHIFIHPYYRYGAEGQDNYYSNLPNSPNNSSEELWEFLKIILSEESRYPTFLFEESWKENANIINAIVSQVNHGNVYLVPTWTGSPTPFVKGQPIPKSQEDINKNSEDSWRKIQEFFKEIGVKLIYVDGCYLNEIEESSTGDALKNLGQCVGSALQNLASCRQFEIKLGSHTFDLTREGLVGFGVDEILPSHLQSLQGVEENEESQHLY